MTALKPDDFDSTFADFNRRLQILESTQRVGLNRVRFAWSTHAAGANPVSTMDVYEGGAAGSSWADDEGNSGTGYPTLTLRIGRKALFFAQATPYNVSTDAGYKASAFRFGIAPDGLTPVDWAAAYPIMYGGATHGPTTEGTQRLSLNTGRADMTPGSHIVKINGRFATGAGGAALPSMYDLFLAVVPVD